MHFYQPMWPRNLVDVMPHPGTSPEAVDVVAAFARRIGQVPIVLRKEHPEYVMNGLWDVIFAKAIDLYRSGVASLADIDRTWMLAVGAPIGPFGAMDLVGLDLEWRIAQNKADVTGDPEDQAVADWFRGFVDEGWLGRKAGRGFYTYPNPAFEQPGFLTGEVEAAPAQA
jgi:3-hydroxybutyryl-CoA dehydrogenase